MDKTLDTWSTIEYMPPSTASDGSGRPGIRLYHETEDSELWAKDVFREPMATSWHGYGKRVLQGPAWEGHFVSDALGFKHIERNRRKEKAAKKARKRNRRRR